MSEKFKLEIITPEKVFLSEEINSATIPSFEGEMTILKDHIPLITFLRPGLLRASGSKETKFFIEEGTVEFSENNLVVLSSTVLSMESLNKNEISKMIDESKNKLSDQKLDDKSRYIISHKLDTLLSINQ